MVYNMKGRITTFRQPAAQAYRVVVIGALLAAVPGQIVDYYLCPAKFDQKEVHKVVPPPIWESHVHTEPGTFKTASVERAVAVGTVSTSIFQVYSMYIIDTGTSAQVYEAI